ncbi:MAG TPA: hypothetical protein VHE35_18590 [Kofleriaceae bacterium]|nr:hypothetical protein [Kofleriaceae bacterium]
MKGNVLAAVLVVSLASIGSIGTASAGVNGGGIEVGFLTGVRSYQAAHFARTEGDTSPSLVTTFQGSPFDRVKVAGLGFEMNFVVNGVRLSWGYARPYTQFSGPIQAMDPETRLVSIAQVRSVDASEKMLAIGYQLGFKKARFSLDLVGTASTVSTDIAIGEQQGTYEATDFGFSLRTGLRYPFHKAFYLYGTGEGGLSGSTTFGATFGVGSGVL